MSARTRLVLGLLGSGCLLAAACANQPGAAPAPNVPTPTSAFPTGASTGPGGTPPSAATASAATPAATSAATRPAQPPAAPSSPSASARARCAELAASLSLRDQVGQLMMVAVSSDHVPETAAEAIQRSRAGSVILLGNTTAGSAKIADVVEQARNAARTPRGVKTLLAADQEGGQVQRLQGTGFDRIPSAEQQADDSPAELTRAAARWGRQLRRAGIDANLAPVADVVPSDLRDVNQPIGVLRRGYGPDPDEVASSVAAFVHGMDAAGVATSIKHFPGLGRVRGNTDFTARVVDDTTTRNDPYLKPFAAGIGAGADMVMISSGYYTEIDSKRRAAFSPTVIKKIVRTDLGFVGVVVSDDLAAAAMQDVQPGDRMLRFLRAGGDLAIVGDPSIAASMADAVVDEARHDDRLAADVQAATIRVLQLKDRRRLADC